jgi:hypothetical protein
MIANQIQFKVNYRVELADTLTGHYYAVWETKNKLKISQKTRKKIEKFLGYYPSSTTILNAYPTSEYLTKWIADNGFHESRAMRDEAGRRGTRIHTAIEALLSGEELSKELYTIEEWHKLDTFVAWYISYQPEILALEVPVFSKKEKYAGRLDCIARVNGLIYVLDWKSSANLHKSFPLQFSSYAKAIEENTDIKIDAVAALQLGAKNKNGYRFVIYDDWRTLHYPVFQHVHATWNYDNFDSLKNPKELPILTLPLTLKLNLNEPEKT